MKITDARRELEAVLEEYSRKITEAGLTAESEIEGYNKDGEPCATDSEKAVGICAVIYVGTEGMTKDDMIGCPMDFTIEKKDVISDVKFAEELQLFKADAEKLIADIAAAENPAIFIENKCAEVEAEAEAAIKRFEHDVAMIEKIGKIAAFVLLGVIVVLGVIIAIL